MRKPTAKTKTAAFGSSGRTSHDAKRFYAGKLTQGLPKESPGAYIENPLEASALNNIFCKSSEDMAELPDNSVHLVVTSPPYNVGKDYDADMTLKDYLAFLKRVWKEVYRVLVPGGRACVNVANLGRRPYIPMHLFITGDMLSLDFLMRGEVIWNKAASAAGSTAWGSWCSPKNPTLRDVHEYILVFSKGSFSRQIPCEREPTISPDNFTEFTKSIWTFPAVSARSIGHPAPFPVDLPQRCIQLYTFEGEVVLDPFMGSGQSAIAAVQAKRHYVGYEVNSNYVRLADRRIDQFKKEFMAPTLFDQVRALP